MVSLGEDAMDFGDEDDGAFLSGKLAALGIDEDLELSGGEEENQDPTIQSEIPGEEGNEVRPPPRERSERSADEHESSTGPRSPTSRSSQVPDGAADPPDAPPQGGGIEDGEVLKMLERPLQTSRDTQKFRRENGRHGRGTTRRENGGRVNGRAKGRNVTIKECARWVCDRLNEPKYYLMCRVVKVIGYNKTKRLLEQVREIQETGGMPTADGSRKRTSGGVFFTLLKDHIDPPKLKELYADELRVKKEKERARRAAAKRKLEAAEAGQEVVTPRDAPRQANHHRAGELPPRGSYELKRIRASESSPVTQRGSRAQAEAAH